MNSLSLKNTAIQLNSDSVYQGPHNIPMDIGSSFNSNDFAAFAH